MAKRSQKIPELKEKTEPKCKWGLFSIFESCQGRRVNRKLISNGRRTTNQQIIGDKTSPLYSREAEYPRRSDRLTRFDEECQRFQNEAYLASDTKSRSDLNLVQEHVPAEKLTNKELKSKRESVPELDDHLIESQRKTTPKAHHHKQPFAFEETSLNKVTFAEVLRTVSPSNNNNPAEPVISEDLTRSFCVRKYDSVDEISGTHQMVQMNVKAFVDQMFIERRLKDRLNSECKSFSDALEVLISTKNSRTHKKEREASKVRSTEEDSLKKSSFTARPNDNEVVVLKHKSQSQIPKYSEDVSCHCSSTRYHHSDSSARVHESDSFSFKKMKKRLKRRSVGPKGPGPFLTCGKSYVLPQNGSSATEVGKDRLFYGTEIKSYVDPKMKEQLWKRPDLKKLEFPEFDVILEAKSHLASRLENVSASDSDGTCKRPPRTLGRILQSPERDFRSLSLSPNKESGAFSGSAQMRYSPYNHSPPQVSTISIQKQIERHRTCLSPSRPNSEILDREESSILSPRTGEESHDTTGESNIVIPKSTRRQEPNNSEAVREINGSNYMRSDTIKPQNDYNRTDNSLSGSVLEHEASTSTASIIQHLDIADTGKYQEEHQSPVSVLEPIFTEEANSPQSTTRQTDKQALQPLRLDFEEDVYDSIPRGPPISERYCIEAHDHISHYVQSVLQGSCLNWDYLSEIELLPQETELVAESLFYLVEFPLTDCCYFDPKLLFDRISEVVLDLCEVYCCLPPWLAAFEKPRIRQVELENIVIDEVMSEAEFFVLPRTERRTLDQLVSKDVRKCWWWLDVRRDTEQIVNDISDDVIEESIVDVLLGLHAS